MHLSSRYWIFIKERYPPLQVTPFLAIESFCGYIIGLLYFDSYINWINYILVLFILWLFYLQLRLFDDIKDFEVDQRVHPTRPLSRGLVSITDLFKLLSIIIGIQLIISVYLSIVTNWIVFLFYSLSLFYSILMRYEFFVSSWIKQHIFIYLITHQIIVPLIMILPYLVGIQYFDITPLGVIYLTRVIIANYCIELLRKTVGKEQEREGYETYSSPSIIGSTGAAILIFLISFIELLPIFIYQYYPNQFWNWLVFGSYSLFVLALVGYVKNPTKRTSGICMFVYAIHIFLALILLGLDALMKIV
ncbi:MAG: hypothetical protein OEY49_11910 [Candidatus Heimdallarchaeota archaeon]|nr:hypothetical protein [Candidatus Heimdallarchaeota archaeon]